MARVERWMTQYQFDAFRWVRRLAGAIDRILAYENSWNNVLRKRRMQVKVVEVDDAIEQSVFEVYAALHLKTTRDHCGYNDF